MVDFMRHKDEPLTDGDAILDSRGEEYGRFMDLASCACRIRNMLMGEVYSRHKVLAPDQEEAFAMLATKLARIINGNSNHLDSWRDASLYLKLVADRIEGKVR